MTSFRCATTAVALGCVAALPSAASAQASSVAIRPLGKIVAVTNDTISTVGEIRVLSDGRVMVNDNGARRVVMFDTSLAHGVVIADTTSSTAKAYGSGSGHLIPYRADSTIFVDRVSNGFLIITPQGKIDRIVAAPRPGDITYFATSIYGATFDGVGSILYRPPARATTPAQIAAGSAALKRDTTALIRVNMATKVVDTITMLRAAYAPVVTTSCGQGCTNSTSIRTPFLLADDWTALSDGTVIALRSGDYHIEWIHPDGSRVQGPKVQHDWPRLTDSIKDFLIDSLKHADSVRRFQQDSTVAAEFAKAKAAGATGGGPGIERPLTINGAPFTPPPQPYAAPEDIPDYRPPFTATPNSVKVDDAGRIWVRVMLSPTPTGGPVYDILDPQGVLTERVQLPGGTSLLGFGPGNAVYILSREASGVRIARARFR